MSGRGVVIPARPEGRKERQEGEPPKPGDPGEVDGGEAEKEEEKELGEQKESEEGGGFDLNSLQLDTDVDDCGVQPRFFGDRALLYSHDTAESTSARRMMVFQGLVAGHQAVVLLDLGANASFVSKEWVQRTGLPERQMAKAMEVTTATGKTYSATSQLGGVEVRVVGSHHRTNLVVAPLSTYDVILGTPWFSATKPHFDWEQWTCNGRPVDSKGGRSVGQPGRTARRVQSMAIGAAHQRVMQALVTKYRIIPCSGIRFLCGSVARECCLRHLRFESRRSLVSPHHLRVSPLLSSSFLISSSCPRRFASRSLPAAADSAQHRSRSC